MNAGVWLSRDASRVPCLGVYVGPGLEQVGDVREPGLLAGRVVERRPTQPVTRVQNLAGRAALFPEYELDDGLTAPSPE